MFFCSAVTHTGAKTAHQLEYRIFYQALVCNTAFYAFRNELLGVGLEVAILAAVSIAAMEPMPR